MARGYPSICQQQMLWLLVAVVLIALSLIAQVIVGALPSIVAVTCGQRKFTMGVHSVCTDNTSVAVWHPFQQGAQCHHFLHGEVPVWINGTHILLVAGAISSLLSLIVLSCYLGTPPALPLSVADGLAMVCFGPAAFHTAGLLNMSSGLTSPDAITDILPGVRGCGIPRYTHGAYLMSIAILLHVVAGVAVLLAMLFQGKQQRAAAYQKYLRERLVANISDAFLKKTETPAVKGCGPTDGTGRDRQGWCRDRKTWGWDRGTGERELRRDRDRHQEMDSDVEVKLNTNMRQARPRYTTYDRDMADDTGNKSGGGSTETNTNYSTSPMMPRSRLQHSTKL